MCCPVSQMYSAVFCAAGVVIVSATIHVPCRAMLTAIQYGTNVTGAISVVNQVDTFLFEGAAGDRVTVRAFDDMRNSADMAVAIELRDSFDQLVAANAATYSGWASIDSALLPADDTYKILLFDVGGDDFANYGLCLQRTFQPLNAALLNYGTSLVGSLSTYAQLDAYSFNGDAGDRIMIHAFDNMKGTSDCAITVAVYNPEGHLIKVDTSKYNDWSAIDSLILTESGQFTIYVYDIGGDDFAAYGISIQRLFLPGNAVVTNYGETKSGKISKLAQIDAYTFSGASGDIVIVHGYDSLRNSTDMALTLALYSPAGHLVASDTATYFGWTTLDTVYLPMTGTYTILAYDI